MPEIRQIADKFPNGEFDKIVKVKNDLHMSWAEFLMKAASILRIYPECMPLRQKLTEAGFVRENCEEEEIYIIHKFLYEWDMSVELDGNCVKEFFFYDDVTEEIYFIDDIPDKVLCIAEPYLRIIGYDLCEV